MRHDLHDAIAFAQTHIERGVNSFSPLVDCGSLFRLPVAVCRRRLRPGVARRADLAKALSRSPGLDSPEAR
jgi:hypothetical protein